MTTDIARRLRRNLTDAERRPWTHLRNRQLGVKFRRQMPKLVIEIDGGQHAHTARSDRERTAVLESAGYLVLRFWNNDALSNTDGVIEEIARTLLARSATNDLTS